MTSDDRLTLARFERLLAAFGADPLHWPVTERTSAVALLAGSLPARRAWKQAQELDRALARFTVATSDASAADRLAAQITPLPQLSKGRRGPLTIVADWLGVELRPAFIWPQAIGLAAAALFGFYIGATDTRPAEPNGFDIVPPIEATL